MNHDPNTSPHSGPTVPTSGLGLPSDQPHGLDPRALLEAVAAPTGGPGGASTLPLPTPDELATSFPQLEIGECLGRGGMGIVYRARQRSLDRVVALKLLAPERGHDPAFADRFAREAQALAKLSHPNIVTIHDFGQAGGFYYLLMEYVDGVNLRQAMQAGRFTPEQALAIVPPVCEALHYAHTHGLVHRDIKPENLLLDKEGRIKIADFGIAKMMDADDSNTGLAESQPAGTPRYMAPEQRDATRRTDHRADIYSLGVVLYELLTGEVPGARLEAPSRRVQIDVRLDEIVLRALEAEPDRRYQTAVELRTRVEELGPAGRSAGIAASTSPHPEKPHVDLPEPPAVPHVLRAGQATVTTLERLATASGQFFHFRNNRHQLVLDDSRLTIADGPQATVIPLTAIRDLSLGQFPRTVNPAGLDFIAVTYADESGERRLLIAPFASVFGTPAGWNAHVHDWWTAIRDATTARTGRAPATTPSTQLGTPGSSPGLLAILLVPLIFGLVLGMWLLDSSPVVGMGRPPSHSPGLVTVVLLTLAALTPILGAGRDSKAGSSWVGPAMGIGAAVLTILALLGRPGPLEIVILLGLAGVAIHHLKKRAEARASGLAGEAAFGSPWVRALVFGIALGLTVLFAAPHLSVLGAGNIETWTVGLPSPWISDIKHSFANGTGQRIREMHLDHASFYCGFGALAAWMLWLRLQAQGRGAAALEVVRPADAVGGRPRVVWGALATVWTVFASLSVIALLLVCVLMRHVLGDFPAPMPLLLLAVFPVSVLIMNGVLQGLRQRRRTNDPRSDGTPTTRPARRYGCLVIFLVGLAGASAAAAALVFFWIAARAPAPAPPAPIRVEPASAIPQSAPAAPATPAPENPQPQ